MNALVYSSIFGEVFPNSGYVSQMEDYRFANYRYIWSAMEIVSPKVTAIFLALCDILTKESLNESYL